jgi:hypothetical protein
VSYIEFAHNNVLCLISYNLHFSLVSTNSFSGPIPGFFLASVDPDTFEFADLSDNILVSSWPIGLRYVF